jgi:hypothetical protein
MPRFMVGSYLVTAAMAVLYPAHFDSILHPTAALSAGRFASEQHLDAGDGGKGRRVSSGTTARLPEGASK